MTRGRYTACGVYPMHGDSLAVEPRGKQIEVTLDGFSVILPAGRQSMAGIRAYLEMLALEQQRVLCSISLDGEITNPSQASDIPESFRRVEARTIALDEMPQQLLRTARAQTTQAIARVESGLALICINDPTAAREIWWQIARDLKDPLVTLSLLPDGLCGPENGRASLTRLRKWQLQQLAGIIKDVDAAAASEDNSALLQSLEKRVLPWLRSLNESIGLWEETVAAGSRFAAQMVL